MLFNMKTAVSIPDDLFELAEELARTTKKSRSQIFSKALREYVARHDPDAVTEALDRVVDEAGQPSDTFVSNVARRTLEHTNW